MVTLMAAYQGGINPRETGLTTAPFDTLKLARRLRDANFSTEQADGMASAIAEAVQTDLATKSDLREMELRAQTGLRELELRLDGKIATLGADLRAEIAATKADIVKWVFGAIGFQTLVLLGALITLIRVVRP
jgi:hypothetical protein